MKIKNLGKLSGVERIGAGEETAYAIGSGGKKVAAWGSGGKGQLGDGETEDSPSPVRTLLEPASPVVEIVGGSSHALARLANGELYAWGADGSGQLGFETGPEADEQCAHDPCSMVPEPVPSLEHVVALGGRRRDQLRRRGRRKRLQGDLLVRRERKLRTARSRQHQPHDHGDADPDPGARLGPLRGGEQHDRGGDPGKRVRADVADHAHVLSKKHSRPNGTSASNRTSSATGRWVRREFGKTLEGSCKSPCSLPLAGLKAQPYEVTLKSPEGKEGREKIRKIIGTPEVRQRLAREHRRTHHQR